MRRLGLSTLALAMVSLGPQAWGHPGHGVSAEPNGIFHYLTEPLHLLPLIALAAAVFVVVRCVRAVAAADRS